MEALKNLGLNDQEIDVYTAVLRLGEVPMADVTQAVSLHPQVIYRLVERLESKGFLHAATKKHRRTVRAEDPKVVLQRENRKVEQLQAALPDLLALQQTSNDALVRVARGDEAVRDLRFRGIEELEPGGTFYVIGASGDRYYDAMGDAHIRLERLREKKRIRRKLLTYESQRSALMKHEESAKYVDMRFLPAHYPIPSSINIFGKTVAQLIWTQEPIVIAIESDEVAKSHLQAFQSLWRAGAA